jgi:ubiquinone/menaquinone biosynthesis C-methylase UbiE
MVTSKEKHEFGEEKTKNMISLNPLARLFENPQKSIEPCVRKGQVVADLGCNKGYYTFALADCVGLEGKVYAVDLREDYIEGIKKKAEELGYHNIEVLASSAADLNFIKDESVDFVLANGLLCNVPEHRPTVVKEIKRILKSTGQAYLSLGSYPPFGFVGREEWTKILAGFRVVRKGGFLQPWALVFKKNDGEDTSVDYLETNKSPRFVKLRKKWGE